MTTAEEEKSLDLVQRVVISAILFINRRRAWHPAAALGLLPGALSAYWMWIR